VYVPGRSPAFDRADLALALQRPVRRDQRHADAPGVIAKPLPFLSNVNYALWSCVAANVWYGIAFFAS
jgi:ABC-type sugar transport system permease subunit